MDDTTEETGLASEAGRELTSWERRLFDGVQMVSREDREAVAEATRRRLEGSPHDLLPRWYGQRLSGTGGNA